MTDMQRFIHVAVEQFARDYIEPEAICMSIFAKKCIE